MKLLSPYNAALFFNNNRGLQTYFFLKTKKINISHMILSKKNLNKKIIKILKLDKISFKIVDKINTKVIENILKNVDIGIICGFPYIFEKKLINIPKYGLINCHAGKLPQYRGGSPLNWAIINNEKFFHLTIIKVDAGIDTGPIIAEKKFKLKNFYTIEDLQNISVKQFPLMVYKSLKLIIKNKKLKKQNIKFKNYYPQRSNKDSKINLKFADIKHIKLMIRALRKPYPEPYFYFNSKKIIINKIKKIDKNLRPGQIIKLKNYYLAGCKNATIKINT